MQNISANILRRACTMGLIPSGTIQVSEIHHSTFSFFPELLKSDWSIVSRSNGSCIAISSSCLSSCMCPLLTFSPSCILRMSSKFIVLSTGFSIDVETTGVNSLPSQYIHCADVALIWYSRNPSEFYSPPHGRAAFQILPSFSTIRVLAFYATWSPGRQLTNKKFRHRNCVWLRISVTSPTRQGDLDILRTGGQRTKKADPKLTLHALCSAPFLGPMDRLCHDLQIKEQYRLRLGCWTISGPFRPLLIDAVHSRCRKSPAESKCSEQANISGKVEYSRTARSALNVCSSTA